MKVVAIDIEANALVNPTQIWVVVCKDLASGQVNIFRDIIGDRDERDRFRAYAQSVDLWTGHNCLEYDFPVLYKLVPGWNDLGLEVLCKKVIDTLIISRLVDYSRPNGHSIEAYGEEFGLEKIKFNDFSKYSKEMEAYCVRDVEICHKIYNHYSSIINDPAWSSSILLEHRFQLIINNLHNNGFSFDTRRADVLLEKIKKELQELDDQILVAFPPKSKLIREIHPRRTKHGTLNRQDFKYCKYGDLSSYNGYPFSRFEYISFNPASHKQLVDVLNNAGWFPIEKTETHKDVERELRKKDLDKDILLKYTEKLEHLKVYGWKINEENLATLPNKAPTSARLLAKRILLESRRRTLVEWLGLVSEDGRIHGKYLGIGAWTHRMAHQKPNTANIPNDKDEQGRTKLYGKEFRSLWVAPKNRLLVGVDAEGIQLRVFAHYINDKEFTNALIKGRKATKTDPHSLNQRVLGSVCKHRQAAKRFIFALLLGAGVDKLAAILECTPNQAKEAIKSISLRYSGFAELKQSLIPKDARRGYFIGLDGRKIIIPSETLGGKKHLAMSGYLQSGEAIIMKMATIKWTQWLKEKRLDHILVNLVHDEWQTETSKNMKEAIEIARLQANALKEVGEELNLNCPLSGAYYDEDRKDYTIGVNWKHTH